MNFLDMANAIRILTVDSISKAKSGHPGMPMGMADVATVLFVNFLKFNPQNPDWADRDRFVLSAGHGSMLLYALLYLTGYEDITLEEIKNFRQLHSKTAGHPEYGVARGIENTSGPLGQGLATAVGMAIAEKLLNNRFGDTLVDHYTYVVAGDGCLMEGISHEACSLAGHLGLNKLVVLFDDNNISIDGTIDITSSDDQMKRFEAYNWHVQKIDGHNYDEINDALIAAQREKNAPSIIACKTVIGKFIPNKAGTSAAHSWPMTSEEMLGVRKNLNWSEAPFEIPEAVLNSWRSINNEEKYNLWQQNLTKEFVDYMNCNSHDGYAEFFANLKKEMSLEKEATRKSSGAVLTKLAEYIPQLIGGSADLSGSNNTKTPEMKGVQKNDFNGSYIYYGIREHAMAACMNGLSLHGGFIPYAGTFFVFTDYCRASIRMSALMKQRVVYVMTHDSIGVGEDGPTHQPVEHLASLRAMPNIYVFRPADSIEVCESWQLALASNGNPSILVLSRQALPRLRADTGLEVNLTGYGAYTLSDSQDKLDVTIFATGSEVHVALAAKQILKNEHKIGVRVVSVPCFELFDQQTKEYRDNILENDSLKVAIEAASKFGWERYIGRDGIFVGLNSFGESANGEELYRYFNITAQHTVDLCLKRLMAV